MPELWPKVRGRGRSGKIVKPFAQITVVVRERAEEEAEKPAKKAPAKKAAPKKAAASAKETA